jgi:hypothetical protein
MNSESFVVVIFPFDSDYLLPTLTRIKDMQYFNDFRFSFKELKTNARNGGKEFD